MQSGALLGLTFFTIVQATSLLAAGAPERTVLVTVETEAELAPLQARMTGAKKETVAAWEFWTGTIGHKTVVLTCSGGDPLNAVAATTLAIRHFAPALVVTVGAARAHDPMLHAGDVVVSGAFAPFDGMFSPVESLGAGSHPLQWKKLPHLAMTPGERETPVEQIAADPAALATAQKLAAPRGRVVIGVLGSSGQVNREADRIAWIRKNWGTSCEDGESAHIAACAQLLGVPALGVRVIDGTADEADGLAAQFLEAAP